MHKIRRSLTLGLGLAVLAPVVAPAGAATPPTGKERADLAAAWILDQQQADGGFELAGFPGFETPDVVLALAAHANISGPWVPAEALTAVRAAQTDGGLDALDAIDALIEDEATPESDAAGARAAKIAAIVAQPLGLSTTAFDPASDGGLVDLEARIDVHAQPDGSYDFGAQFNGALYTAIAIAGSGSDVPAGLVSQIRAAQRGDGSWDYTGTGGATGSDVDTTALALIALRSARVATTDADVVEGIEWLAGTQQASGAWQSFGTDDPNSTSLAAMALTDQRIDLTTSGWRTTYGAPVSGTYVSPYTWLTSQQQTDGRIASPNDGFGVNTFPTSQTLQAQAGQWYAALEMEALVDAWSLVLASPAATPATGYGLADIGGLGGNASVKVARTVAAGAVVNGLDGRKAAAADLFQQAFGRTIDPSGSAYWSAKLATLSRPEVLARLTGSSEFYRRAGGTIPSFVDKVYVSVLGRNPDPSGRAYWIKKLQGGTSVQAVARSLTASNEYRRKQVDAAYLRVLDRAPSADERTYWTARIATTRIEVLLAALASASELYGSLEG
jgi:hypothetical protein